MRAVIQRVAGASVDVVADSPASDGENSERISGFTGEGLLVLVGVTHGDGPEQVEYIARKICELRILEGERSVLDAGAPVMLVSQFTLYADTRKGRRPSWNDAAPGPVAEPVFNSLVEAVRERGVPVETGQFGAHMRVSLTNNGPVTILLEK
ncbi:D-aminoacyl-tRNA deacylase [Dermabacteraceae bacterium P7054]